MNPDYRRFVVIIAMKLREPESRARDTLTGLYIFLILHTPPLQVGLTSFAPLGLRLHMHPWIIFAS